MTILKYIIIMIQSFEDINLEDDIKNSFSNYIIKNFSNLKIFIRE